MAEQEQKMKSIKLTTDLKQFIDGFVTTNFDEDTKSWGDYSQQFYRAAKKDGWTLEQGLFREKVKDYGQGRIDI